MEKISALDILRNSCTTMISAILLAAGESNRMGQPKQLMPLGQSTIEELLSLSIRAEGEIPLSSLIKYKGELLNLKGDIGGREIVKRHPDNVLEVEVNCEGVLFDIDTMESYTPIFRQ